MLVSHSSSIFGWNGSDKRWKKWMQYWEASIGGSWSRGQWQSQRYRHSVRMCSPKPERYICRHLTIHHYISFLPHVMNQPMRQLCKCERKHTHGQFLALVPCYTQSTIPPQCVVWICLLVSALHGAHSYNCTCIPFISPLTTAAEWMFSLLWANRLRSCPLRLKRELIAFVCHSVWLLANRRAPDNPLSWTDTLFPHASVFFPQLHIAIPSAFIPFNFPSLSIEEPTITSSQHHPLCCLASNKTSKSTH